MSVALDGVLGALAAAPSFQGWADEDLRLVEGVSRLRRFHSGEVIVREGAPADRLYLLLAGHVELSTTLGLTDANLVDVLEPPQSFGECSLIAGELYPVTARGVADGSLIEIDGAALAEVFAARFDLVMAMMSGLSRRLRYLLTQLAEVKCKSAAQRLGLFLLQHADCRHGLGEVALPFDKRTLAAKLGMKPETLSRAFRKLSDVGVQQEAAGKVVVVTDTARLAAFCDIA